METSTSLREIIYPRTMISRLEKRFRGSSLKDILQLDIAYNLWTSLADNVSL